MLGNGHGKAAQNGGEDRRTQDLCNGERDVGKDGETGEDAQPALAIFESVEDKTNRGSIPKSYLLGTGVRRRQIRRKVRRVGRDTAGDLPRRLLIDGMRRVSPDAGTEDGGTGVIARVRH